MKRAPEWTQAEFDPLLANSEAPTADLIKLLPLRSAGAIDVVKEGIHANHTGTDDSMLSKMMKERLVRSHGAVTCPKCRGKI